MQTFTCINKQLIIFKYQLRNWEEEALIYKISTILYFEMCYMQHSEVS